MKPKIQSLYDRQTEPSLLEEKLIEIKGIMLLDEGSDLEKLHAIHDVVYGYDKNYIPIQRPVQPKAYKVKIDRNNP